MRNATRAEEGVIRAEYDFSKAQKNAYAERANAASSLVSIDADLFAAFPSSEAVNRALRLVLEDNVLVMKARMMQDKAS
jgi:hypothetical protein